MLYLGNSYKYMVKAGTIVRLGFRNGTTFSDVVEAPLEQTFVGDTALQNSDLPLLEERLIYDVNNVFIYCKKKDMIFLPSKN